MAHRITRILVVIGLSWVFTTVPACNRTHPDTILAPHGGIACSEPIAASAGLQILQQGGNAMDALITVAFAMAVTYPRAGNLGGGGFLIYRSAEGNVQALDFRETAPAAATYDMYWNENDQPDPQKSLVGPLAAGIPGTVRGLYQAHRKFGSLPWESLLQPAIQLARDGFAVNAYLSNLLKSREEKFRQFSESYRIFFPGGKQLQPGDTLRQTDLAHTLTLIAQHGDRIFYEGEIADKIVTAVKAHGGIFSIEDFRNYRAVERQPVKISYRGHIIYSMPPPSSGGLVLQGILNTLANFELPYVLEHNSPDYLALITETEKRWYAMRNLYLGDPDFVEIPYHLFSDPKKASEIASMIDPQRPVFSRQMPEFRQIAARKKESPQTTHISIVDHLGNAVAMTYTLNGSFGSYFVAEGTGILLNNEMDDFSVKPGSPNMFGLVQGWVNAIAPGKRMLSSMTPTLVEKDGEVVGVLGTPGGSTIITSVLQVLLNKIDYHMSLSDALAAGRFHHQWLPDSIVYEQEHFPSGVIRELQERGFAVKPVRRIGDVQAIWRLGTQWEICSDPRSNGYPMGY